MADRYRVGRLERAHLDEVDRASVGYWLGKASELRKQLKEARRENGKLAERIHDLRVQRDRLVHSERNRIAEVRKLHRQVEKLLRRVSKEQSRADRAESKLPNLGLVTAQAARAVEEKIAEDTFRRMAGAKIDAEDRAEEFRGELRETLGEVRAHYVDAGALDLEYGPPRRSAEEEAVERIEGSLDEGGWRKTDE